MPTVLVIDDNPSVATALETLFSLHEIDTRAATSPEEGLALLDADHGIDLVVQDMNFRADTTSGEEGAALFGEIRARHPDLPVILLTAWTHLESAVDLVRAGAADYLGKPWDDRKLMATVNNLLELSQARRELERERAGRAGAARRWRRTTTCAAWSGRTRPPRRCCGLHCRSRARTCRCSSPGPMAPARRRSPRSSMPTPRCAMAPSSR
jgi:DNA-binding NtrC family response regulator